MMASGTQGTWAMDSGASNHMTGDAGLLSGLSTCSPVDVKLADGQVRWATRSGSSTLSLHGPSLSLKLKLCKVLLVQGLAV